MGAYKTYDQPEFAMNLVHLEIGESSLVVTPRTGSAIAKLVLAGQEILRPVSLGDVEALAAADLGEFPMAPWVNRTAHSRFSLHGRQVDISTGASADPHALHGLAWRYPWTIVEQTETELVLQFEWIAADAWPFSFFAKRRFQLEPDACLCELELTNAGGEAMPACAGFHPFFPAAGASIRALVKGAWETDADGIPTHVAGAHLASSLSDMLVVGGRELDHSFTDWDGSAELIWPSHSVRIETRPSLHFLQVYTPAGADFFCVEPQSAMPDALNRPPEIGGLTTLAPGERLAISMRLTCERRAE